ncbi:cation:dicarboxylase symporter family transporter, partial [Pseudomonas syringae pv. tagetis]|uniref:cation:dicarboxylate symporter family transporter n=1 Tax=Pseudomonas syringae group genomosp. 7 TaxID=251699 RepID=UPI0037704DF7
LILGIDQFFDMARTATNVVGNSIATAVVAKSEPDEEVEDQAENIESQTSTVATA